MRLQLKPSQRMNDNEKKEVKRSNSTTNFLKKDQKLSQQQQDSLNHQQSYKYIEGAQKNSHNTLSYNQSVQSLKSDENSSAKQSLVFQAIDQNIINNHGLGGIHLRTPSMEKELKKLTCKLAIERQEIENELKKSKYEVDRWKDKYDSLKKASQFQSKNGPNQKSNGSLQDNESIIKSYSDLSGIQNKHFNDSSNSIFYGLSNTVKSQVSEKDVKQLAQKFAIERVGLENQIKNLQSQRSDLENQVEYNKQETQNLKYMYQELEKQKDMEITNFKRKLQDNEFDLKRNIQQEFIKLGENFAKEKSSLEKKSLFLEDELDQLKRENQTLIDTIHSLNLKTKAQNDFIQNLTSNKQEQSVVFDKVSQLERELQYITDELLKEQECKQGLLDRVASEKNRCDNLQQQLEDQKKNNDRLSTSSKEINNKFSEIINQLKYEQQRSEQLEYQNQKLKDNISELNMNPPQFGSDYKMRYEEEKKRNIDLLNQIDQQRELIDQMKQQIEMFEEFSQKLTTNAQINQENNEIEKSEYQRQIQYLNDALRNLQSRLALKLRILQKTYKLLLVDSHLKSKLTLAINESKSHQIKMSALEESLTLKQIELGETQGKLGVCEMELSNKRKEIFDKQSQILDLQEQIRERAAGEINSYEISSLKIISQQEEDNQSLSDQNNLTEQLLNKMREQLTAKEQEFLTSQQQLNNIKLQQSNQDDLQIYQKKVEEQKKLVEQNRTKMADLLKIIEQKDKSISELQKDITELQQQFDYKFKNAQFYTEDNNFTKINETEKNDIHIRSLETVYEQRITQLQHIKTSEEEKYIQIVQTKSEENRILSQKVEDYLSKMNILSNEMENLQMVINQKDQQINEFLQEIQQQKIQSFQIHTQNIQESQKQNNYEARLSRTQSFNFNQTAESTLLQQSSNQSQQIISLKFELDQTKQQLQERIKKDEYIIQELTYNLNLMSKEQEIKNGEIRKMVQQDQSKSLVNSFSKDSTINLKADEINTLTRKVQVLEEEKRQLEYEKWNGLTKNDQSQGGNTEQYIQQLFQNRQTIQQLKDKIEELINEILKYQNEIYSLKDQLQSKKMSEYDLNRSISNSLSSIEADVQTSKLKREIQQLTQLCESQEQSLKILQGDNITLKKQLEDTQTNYDISERNLVSLKTHIIKITEDNEKLVNKIKDLSLNNSNISSRQNSIYSNSQYCHVDQNFENFKREVDRQKQIYLQEIAELNQKVEKCSFDRRVLSQEVEILRDNLKQKERQLEVFQSEIKINSQTDRLKNINNLTISFMNEKQKTHESQSNQLKSEQTVFMDGTENDHKQSIEWEKEIRKNVEDEIKLLAQKYLQQKSHYERIIAELKVQLGALQKQLEEQKEISNIVENTQVQNSQNENLKKMIELKNSENRSLQTRLESTENQKNEEIKKLKKEIQRIHEENLNKSSFEVYAERIGYQSAIMEQELKIKELEDQLTIYQNQLGSMKNKKVVDSLEFLQQIQTRNAWQIEVSKLIEELKFENKQLHSNVFEQEQTIAKLQLQNTSLIIQDSYYILSK